MTPPPTARNMAPMFKMELSKMKDLTSPWISGGRHKLRGFSDARGPVPMSRTGMPNESKPHAKIALKRKLRVRVSAVIICHRNLIAAGAVDGWAR
jgi:hypothetical protein